MKCNMTIQMLQFGNLIGDRAKVEWDQCLRLVIADHSDCTAGVNY